MPVTWLAKWKTTVQLLALGFFITGPAGVAVYPWTMETGTWAPSLAVAHSRLSR